MFTVLRVTRKRYRIEARICDQMSLQTPHASARAERSTLSLLRILVIIFAPERVRTEAASKPMDSARRTRTSHSAGEKTPVTVKISGSMNSAVNSVKILYNPDARCVARLESRAANQHHEKQKHEHTKRKPGSPGIDLAVCFAQTKSRAQPVPQQEPRWNRHDTEQP